MKIEKYFSFFLAEAKKQMSRQKLKLLSKMKRLVFIFVLFLLTFVYEQSANAQVYRITAYECAPLLGAKKVPIKIRITEEYGREVIRLVAYMYNGTWQNPSYYGEPTAEKCSSYSSNECEKQTEYKVLAGTSLLYFSID